MEGLSLALRRRAGASAPLPSRDFARRAEARLAACGGLLWFLLAGLLAAGGATAQPTRQAVEQARRAAQEEQEAAAEAARAARAAAAEERRLAERRVDAARRVQGAEGLLSALKDRAQAAQASAEEAREEVAARAAAIRPMLPLMYRLASWPAESLLAVPAPADEALRGLLVLQGLSRQLASDAAAFRAAEQTARSRAAAAETEANRLATAEAAAREAVAALEAELAATRQRRSGLQDSEEAAARRAAAAAAEARDLEGALVRLEREREKAEREQARREARERQAAERAARRRPAETQQAAARQPEPEPVPAPAAHGGRAVPVAGRVSRDYGASADGGPANGQTYAAPAHARVVSPCGGRVAFAGPFRSFGLLVIVDCGEGHHFVLAGLDRLDTSPGRRILAGEPVGVLGAGDRGRASLYVELRLRGQAVDPRPWFAVRG